MLRSGIVLDPISRTPFCRNVSVHASFEKVCTRQELNDSEGRFRANVAGKRILIQEYEGTLYCLSNVCTHLKLPLVGRTAIAQGQVVEGCMECPFHKTKFKLDSGEVVGDWAPTFPAIPFVGKGDPAPLPTFPIRETEEGDIEVEVA